MCTPIAGPHCADEIHLPWKLVVNALKLQIINVLVHRKRYTINNALYKHFKSLVQYDPEIDEIIETLMKECPWKGFPVTLGRNPRHPEMGVWALWK